MEFDLDLDIVRRCALRWPIWQTLNQVAVESDPLRRCVIVAKALAPLRDDPGVGHEAAQAVEVLKHEAKRRRDGTSPNVPALAAPAPQDIHAKERHGA